MATMRPFAAVLWLLSISVVALCLVEYGAPEKSARDRAASIVPSLTPKQFVGYLRAEADQSALEVAARSVRDTHPVPAPALFARYASGARRGQPIGPDIEAWFNGDYFQGRPGIVAQWARTHVALARAWVECQTSHRNYVDAWATAHPSVVAAWVKSHPREMRPNESDLAVTFFENFSSEYPGRFPTTVVMKSADGKPSASVQPVDQGRVIQAVFFDMWLQDHSGTAVAGRQGRIVQAVAMSAS